MQPTHQEKILTLEGLETGWGYVCSVPPVCTANWSIEDWIVWIGDNWVLND